MRSTRSGTEHVQIARAYAICYLKKLPLKLIYERT